MKQVVYIICLVFLLGCSGENVPDCFQTAGQILQQSVPVSDFDRILVNRDIELILKQDDAISVVIETGENLLSDVSAKVVNGQLVLTDANSCNYVRDYGITKIYVSAPHITEIKTSTQYDIRSDGTLNYPNLTLLAENFNAPDTFPVGDFRLDLNSQTIRIVSNNLSFFYLSGFTANLNVNFAEGNGRFEGANLIADTVVINHRGTNDMVVNPQMSLTGVIRSTGNVVSKNTPPVVDVEELFTGSLIFD